MSARSRLNSEEFAELQHRRQASAEAVARGRAHRALPLSVVEAKSQAARKPWPASACTNGCHTSVCDCGPREGASASSEFLADPPRRQPPSVPWRELGAGLLVLLFAISCVHVIATAAKPAAQVGKR